MAERLSGGSLQVIGGDTSELNDTFRRIRQELDELRGLNGRVVIHDRLGVERPSAATDAAQLANTALQVPLRIVDSIGTLIHAFGTSL